MSTPIDITPHTAEPITAMTTVPTVIKTIQVAEMPDDEFADYAAGFTAAQAAQIIKNAHTQGLLYVRRGAWWYYLAGRWLKYAEQTKLYGGHGDWENWCVTACGISRVTAGKYMKFYETHTAPTVKSFGDERFNLDRVLGYGKKKTNTAQQQKAKASDAKAKPNKQTQLDPQADPQPTNTVEEAEANHDPVAVLEEVTRKLQFLVPIEALHEPISSALAEIGKALENAKAMQVVVHED